MSSAPSGSHDAGKYDGGEGNDDAVDGDLGSKLEINVHSTP